MPCSPLVGSLVPHESGPLQFCTLMSSLPVRLVCSSGQAGLCLPKAFSASIQQAEVSSRGVVASALSAHSEKHNMAVPSLKHGKWIVVTTA